MDRGKPCELPPCPPCPPLPPKPCPQVCPPPAVPPKPACRVKPVMRGLHWKQTKGKIAQAFILSITGGAAYYFLVGQPRIAAYKEYYSKADLNEQASEMARKGLFQSVPQGANSGK